MQVGAYANIVIVTMAVNIFKYLRHKIWNNLSHDADSEAKISLLYAKTKIGILRRHLYYCSADVKKQLFIAFFSIIYTRVVSHLARGDTRNITWVVSRLDRSDAPNITWVVSPWVQSTILPHNQRPLHQFIAYIFIYSTKWP